MSVRLFYCLCLLLLTCGCIASGNDTALAMSAEVQVSGDRPLHHTDDGFTNPYLQDKDKNFFSFMRMRYFSDQTWADQAKLSYQVPVTRLDADSLQLSAQQPRVSWLGHSTFLIQYRGINILTDPIFSDRASPVSFAGPLRYVPHVIDYQRLPPIDLVIISHNHYDHLDESSIQALADQTMFAVPLGLKRKLTDLGVSASQVTEMDWWQQQAIAGTKVQALPSQHWSARGLGDRFETLWASWSVRIQDFSFWFAGDTGYNPVQFRQIGENSGGFDLALIPIGAYAPRWFMGDYHINPEEAVQIHREVKSNFSIGMHWGTFPLTAEEPGEPPIRLRAAKKRLGIEDDKFVAMTIGQSILLPLREKKFTRSGEVAE